MMPVNNVGFALTWNKK